MILPSRELEMRLWMNDLPVLLIDAEHNEVHALTQWQAYLYHMGMGYAKHWDIKPDRLTLKGADPRDGLSVFLSHERVRSNWYRENGLREEYVPKTYTGWVNLKHSLWEQAEARHKKDKAMTKEMTLELRRGMKEVLRGANYGRAAGTFREQRNGIDVKTVDDVRLSEYRFVGISEPSMKDMVDNDFLMKLTGDEWAVTETLDAKTSAWIPQGEIYIMSGKKLEMPDA
jgi:hypothetical protein